MNELSAYAAGRWSDFHGLDRCSLADADATLGPALDDQLLGGMFGGEPTQFRRYPASTVAPGGITGWVLGDVVVRLEIRQAVPPPAGLDDLGPPDAVIGSELGPSWSQELWPDRGLVLHRHDDVIGVVFGLKAYTVEGWESDPLRWWRIERRRR